MRSFSKGIPNETARVAARAGHLEAKQSNAGFLRPILLALLAAAAIQASAQTTISLIAGWNLLGNGTSTSFQVAEVFGDQADVATVWKWVPGKAAWAFYAPSLAGPSLTDYTTSKGYEVLTSVSGGEGFWVNAKTNFTVQLPAGTPIRSASFQNIAIGWSLIATGDNPTPAEFNKALSVTPPAQGVIPLNLTTLWAWDAQLTNWYFYSPMLEVQSSTAHADYTASKGYLNFGSNLLGVATGFWVNVPAGSGGTTNTASSTTTTSAITTTTAVPISTTTSTTAAATTTTTTATTTTTTLTRTGSATNFTASAMAGELLTYKLDTAALTYSYTITESQYGLTDRTGSGTLTDNGDGTYTPSGIGNGTVATLANGLLHTSIRETVRGVPATIPVIGISNPVTTLSNTTFNYIQRACWGTSCESDYGTFRLTTAETWISCPSGNLTTGCSQGYSGTVKSLGGGMWQVFDALGVNVGTAAVLSSAGQQVVFLDLKDTRPYGFGVGLLVGSTQQTGTTAQSDGTWAAASSAGDSAQFLVSGNQSTCLVWNGMPCGNTTALTFNAPWAGFVTTSWGGHALLAGTGMYALQEPGDYVEIGIKIR